MKRILSMLLTITIILTLVAVAPFAAQAEVSLDDSKVYIECDGEYFEVEQGSTYTYEYCLKVSDSNVTGIDATTYYDAQGMRFVPDLLSDKSDDLNTMFPVLSKVVLNYADLGMVSYNCATADGDNFRNDNTVVFRGNFQITASSGVYEINTRLKTLTNYEMDVLAYNFEKLGEYEETQQMPKLSPVQDATQPPVTQAGYYLVGDLNGKDMWFVDETAENRILTDTDGDGIYTLNWTFYMNDELKVVYFDGTQITRWYKDENQPNYGIGIAEKTGLCTVSFDPTGESGYSYTYFTVKQCTTQPTIAPTVAPTTAPTQAPTQAPTMNPNATWTVAGEAGLCGNAWQMPPNSSNYMTYNSVTDRFEIVYTGVAKGTYEFKVINGTTWEAPNYNLNGQANSTGNASVTVSKSGSTVIISTDGERAYVEVVEIATEAPTTEPTEEPTVAPTQAPTQKPTQAPTQKPTVAPTAEPTEEPTVAPTVAPTQGPTQPPTMEPTVAPTLGANEIHVVAGDAELCGSNWDPADKNNQMTYNADKKVYEITYENVDKGTYEFKVTTDYAWGNPEYNLDGQANNAGKNAEVTVPKSGMTVIISFDGTKALVEVREAATEAPTQAPTQKPTVMPTAEPTEEPTVAPTVAPTQGPTQKPTAEPTEKPTQAPTAEPTQPPTQGPTQKPTVAPTQPPTQGPTQPAQTEPTQAPTQPLTQVATDAPTEKPTDKPTEAPTQPSVLIGDVDLSGKVNIFDATKIQLYLAEYEQLSDTQMIAADADRNGKVNIFDVTQIQLYLAEYIPQL